MYVIRKNTIMQKYFFLILNFGHHIELYAQNCPKFRGFYSNCFTNFNILMKFAQNMYVISTSKIM